MKDLTAKDIMSSNVLTVRDNAAVRDAAELFQERMISGAPVVDADGKLVGMLSASDIAQRQGRVLHVGAERRGSDEYLHGWEGRLDKEDFQALHVEEDDDGFRVRDIMTEALLQADEGTPVPALAEAMVRGRLHRLPVTRGGRLVGIVTTLDLLKVLCRAGGKEGGRP